MQDQYKRLNVDVAESITELRAVLKEFKLKKDIWRVLFRGKGLEFDGYRAFSPEDDAQDIDWKASSRGQKLLVKRYKEERDMKIMFLIDSGSNMVFGSTEKIKCEYATELVAAFANVLISANDQIGFLFFGDKINPFLDFKSGKRHMDLFVDLMSRSENYGGASNLNSAIEFATEVLDTSVLAVIIVSDFLSLDENTEKKLNILSHRFETIAFQVNDPLDFEFPDVEGEFSLEDPLSHEQVIVNPRVAKAAYEKYAKEHQELIDRTFKRTEVDSVKLRTDKSFAVAIASFIKERLIYKS